LNFFFEHGDADAREEYLEVCQGMTETELVAYYTKSLEISKQIDYARSTGSDLPDDFENTARSGRFSIPVELDHYAKMHMSGYYAASGIKDIFFYNEDGEKFKVSI